LLLALASTVILSSESHGTHGHILLSDCSGSFTTIEHSVRTPQETHYVTTTKPNRLMLFGETVAVYYENHTEHTNTLCWQNARYVKADGTYSDHWALKG
jgi:hypothetical protein